MTDNEIKALRDTYELAPESSHLVARHTLIALADEALRREAANADHCQRITSLTNANEQLLERLARLEAALRWCSGSADFAPGGQGRQGWEKIVQPLLDRAALDEKP